LFPVQTFHCCQGKGSVFLPDSNLQNVMR
jgi:hypothetical protein